MRKLRAGLGAGLCALLFFVLPAIPAGQEPPRPVRILFLGNSYTYFNNLPEILTKLAEAGGQARVEAAMIAPGGWRLKDHWEKGEARPTLQAAAWDVVALQDQSTLGLNYYLDGLVRIAGDQVFRPFAEKWIAEIRGAGATPMLYLTWARKATPQDQAALTSAYMRAAKDFGARVAPVGLAWESLRRDQPGLELYYADGSHPSAAGSYLAACVFYAAVFHRSPEGLPAKISGIPVNLETAKPEPERTAVLVDLAADLAQAVQRAAWNACQELDRAGGVLDVPAVPAPELPPLPQGEALDAAEIEGTWAGDLSFYPPPFLPAHMELALRREAGALKGRLTLQYHSSRQPDQTLDLDDLRAEGNELRFSDPKAAQNLAIAFRGVKAGADELRGRADASQGSPEATVRLCGTWRLRRK